MFIWKPPEVTPFWFPLKVNPPVAVDPDAKHGEEVEKLRLVMFTPLPLLWVKVAVKLKTGDPPEPELSSAAVQFPLILPLFELVPHPTSIIAIPSTTIVPSVFITLHICFYRLLALSLLCVESEIRLAMRNLP